MPLYLTEHLTRARDGFEATANPDGYIGLAVAENRLVWDLVRPKLVEPRVGLSHDDICYNRWIWWRRSFNRKAPGIWHRSELIYNSHKDNI